MDLDVRQFLELGAPERLAQQVRIPEKNLRSLCRGLIEEEVNKELLLALEDDDIVRIADGIMDSIYVLIHAAISYGIPFEPIWRAVADSNMAKVKDGVRKDPFTSKILKPAGWTAPPVREIIARACPRVTIHCPSCGVSHFDRGVYATLPHRTHVCTHTMPDAENADGCGQWFRVRPDLTTYGVVPRDNIVDPEEHVYVFGD
jgi:hypothetical protein